jgi:DNA (cytosine-5)-methyltransferase 1
LGGANKMTAYYNEIDPYAAQWLRNLIAAGHLAKGEVDERSITEVQYEDLLDFNQCHFFAGIGVWGYALRQAGWADDRPVWTGSCPCQPFSSAGKQEGFADERHLWPAWFKLIRKCRPPVIVGEQVASALDWLDLVSTDMEDADYAFGASDLCAAGFGGAHIRQRLYWMANANNAGLERHGRLEQEYDTQGWQVEDGYGSAMRISSGLADTDSEGREQGQRNHTSLGYGNTATATSIDGGLADTEQSNQRSRRRDRSDIDQWRHLHNERATFVHHRPGCHVLERQWRGQHACRQRGSRAWPGAHLAGRRVSRGQSGPNDFGPFQLGS